MLARIEYPYEKILKKHSKYVWKMQTSATVRGVRRLEKRYARSDSFVGNQLHKDAFKMHRMSYAFRTLQDREVSMPQSNKVVLNRATYSMKTYSANSSALSAT